MPMESRIKGWNTQTDGHPVIFRTTLHGQLRTYAHARIYIHASDVLACTHLSTPEFKHRSN